MDDDDRQPSHEQLNELEPEQNQRPFFDLMRDREETDEERLRKKLDEELKEAARKRATDFEEEQRAEERREVAETRKLKKRWRAKLVEKSKRLLEEVAERGDEPTNGYEIAKLMVAERIVKLHEILTTEDLRKSEMKSLKIHIDFMGLLSEKLDRPELEVPEEVDELYQTIAASVEEVTGETPPVVHARPIEAAPISEADAAYTAFATSIVQAIRRTLQPENVYHAPSDAGGGGDAEQTNSPTINSQNPQTRRLEDMRLTEQLLNIVKDAALSGEDIKHEISHTEHSRKLADVAERAAMIDWFVTKEVNKPIRIPRVGEKTDTAGSDLEPQRVEKTATRLPEKKVKYMTELELVTLAEKVQVPGGRFLSDIYKKGELDREGLIKVLKSYTKGWDYRSEFVLQQDKWRRHKEASLEYLTQPTQAQDPASVSSQTPSSTPQKDSASSHTTSQSRTQRPSTSPNHEPASTTQNATELEDTIPEYQPAQGTARRFKSTPRSNTLRGKLRNIGLGHGTQRARGENASETQLINRLKERVKRQGQMTLLVISVVLVIIVVVVVIELSSL